MKPLIIALISTGGLCNRMRTMAGVLDLATKLHAYPLFFWVEMPDMNARFDALFKNFPAKVFSLKQRGRIFKISEFVKNHWSCVVVDDDYVRTHCKTNDTTWFDSLKGKNLFVTTCENITGTREFSVFSPTYRILRQIDKRIDENTVGVHIRRTDNEKSVLYSPTELFVERIGMELKKNPNSTFYLATDDVNEESELKRLFGSCILTYHKRSLDRNDPKGIEDALIDLVNLSRCRMILGSYYSSFSDTAAEWGKIEKEVLML